MIPLPQKAQQIPTCLFHETCDLPEDYQPTTWAIELLREQAYRQRLIDAKTHPTQSVLISGPSGVGKTTSARWVGQQMSVPVYTMLLSQVMGQHMNETGERIAQGFTFAISHTCVLIVDEIDAIGSRRDQGRTSSAGKEHANITNSLIQWLDIWHSQPRRGVLFGTTNLPGDIDVAIRRRFEEETEVNLPSTLELSSICGVPVPDDLALTHAGLRRMMHRSRRHAILHGGEYETVLAGMFAKHLADQQTRKEY